MRILQYCSATTPLGVTGWNIVVGNVYKYMSYCFLIIATATAAVTAAVIRDCCTRVHILDVKYNNIYIYIYCTLCMCHMSISPAHVAIYILYTVDVIICIHVPHSYHSGRYLIANSDNHNMSIVHIIKLIYYSRT